MQAVGVEERGAGGDKAVFNIHSDNEAFATGVFEFAERGEYFRGWEWCLRAANGHESCNVEDDARNLLLG